MVTRSFVSRVEVDTQPGGDLVVRWEIDGEAIAVDVAFGPTPDHVDHVHAWHAPAGTTSTTLTRLGPGRHFVSVSPKDGGPALVAPDRRVVFEGVTNFRDLGGYRTGSGDRLRWGMVFRGEALAGLTPGDIATYEALGVRTIYDLRGELESKERPNPFDSRLIPFVGRPAGAPEVVAPVVPEPAPAQEPTRAPTIEDGERVLRDLYVGLIDHAGPQIGELLGGLASADHLPAVFHCHAGKDRTGIAAALLLDLLGVDRETVLDDYELTGRYRFREQQQSSFQRMVDGGMTPEAAAGVLTTPRWAMRDALAHLDAAHGGVESYLRGPAGMAPEQLDGLRALLLSTEPLD